MCESFSQEVQNHFTLVENENQTLGHGKLVNCLCGTTGILNNRKYLRQHLGSVKHLNYLIQNNLQDQFKFGPATEVNKNLEKLNNPDRVEKTRKEPKQQNNHIQEILKLKNELEKQKEETKKFALMYNSEKNKVPDNVNDVKEIITQDYISLKNKLNDPKKAWTKMMLTYHPDKCGGQMAQIASRILNDLKDRYV